MPVRIEPLEGAIGALVHGLDSRRPLEPEDFATVEQAMFDHAAIVILQLCTPIVFAQGCEFPSLKTMFDPTQLRQ